MRNNSSPAQVASCEVFEVKYKRFTGGALVQGIFNSGSTPEVLLIVNISTINPFS